MREVCAFGYSCPSCYPNICYSEEEEEEGIYCTNCNTPHNEYEEVTYFENGDCVCNSCFCYKCGNLRKQNAIYNGVECLPEEFFKVSDKNFLCKTCYSKEKKKLQIKKRFKFLIK